MKRGVYLDAFIVHSRFIFRQRKGLRTCDCCAKTSPCIFFHNQLVKLLFSHYKIVVTVCPSPEKKPNKNLYFHCIKNFVIIKCFIILILEHLVHYRFDVSNSDCHNFSIIKTYMYGNVQKKKED